MSSAWEVNFDGLIGPTHNYSGLSSGNVASMSHRGAVSRPRAAALQGLEKMRALADLGLKQAFLPPHERPAIATLRALGFRGSDAQVLKRALVEAPGLLAACASASNMWVANAATVTPSTDSSDRRVHFTPANLVSKFHRSIEPPQTLRTLRAIFRDPRFFEVHEPVPGGQGMGDEGAANHTLLTPRHGRRGLHFFVYGHAALHSDAKLRVPRNFPSRQAMEASQAIARGHGIPERQVVFAQQNPEAIDAGVFHNDVISVGNEGVFFHHERAFADARATIAELRRRYAALHRGAELVVVEVPERKVPLREAVRSYLFNSQIVSVGGGRMLLVAPAECQSTPRVRDFMEGLMVSGKTPLADVRYFDLRESMKNGGGPACLWLRVTLNEKELAAIPAGVTFDTDSHRWLVEWVKAHYPETLTRRDLADPQLLETGRRALDLLTQRMGVGSIYPFQLEGTGRL